MKKLLFLLFGSLLLSSCACILSQIPPQYVYADVTCTAAIPDYKTSVSVTGGCTGYNLTQTPIPGTMLSATNKTTTVIIKATGLNGKSSQISFSVTMLDTVTPKIVPIGILAETKLKKINDIYDVADFMVKSLFEDFENRFPYDSLGIIPLIDSSYYKKMLIVVSRDSTESRSRFITLADSIKTY